MSPEAERTQAPQQHSPRRQPPSTAATVARPEAPKTATEPGAEAEAEARARARIQARSTTTEPDSRPEAPQTARVETKLFSNVALGVPCDLPELARTSRPHVQGKRKLRRHATTSQNELSRYQNSNGLWWMFREPSPWDSQSEAAWQWGWSGGDFSNWGDDY